MNVLMAKRKKKKPEQQAEKPKQPSQARSKRRRVKKKKDPKDTQFRKGKSGNPGGRPKGSLNLIGYLRKHLAEVVAEGDDPEKKKTRGQRLMELFAKHSEGAMNTKHLQMLLDRIEGPVPTKVVGADEDEAPLVINIVRQEKPE